MTRQLEQSILRKLQLAECRVLEDFIKICSENNIQYFIFAGCGIGVERHKGFIPWDDDIDIGMLREDYNTFIKIIKRDYSDKYKITDIGEMEEYPFFIAKFDRKGTRNVPEIFECANVDMGIGLEIFPFDNVSDNPWQRKKQFLSVFFWEKIKILREFGHPVLHIDGWKKQVVSIISIIVHEILKSCHVSHKFINMHYLKNATKYNRVKTSSISTFWFTTPSMCIIKYSDLFPLVSKKFEYLTVNVPQKNHEYLCQMYGNYMELPPIEKRTNHVPSILDFGDLNHFI